jgi:hypothetical protein
LSRAASSAIWNTFLLQPGNGMKLFIMLWGQRSPMKILPINAQELNYNLAGCVKSGLKMWIAFGNGENWRCLPA